MTRLHGILASLILIVGVTACTDSADGDGCAEDGGHEGEGHEGGEEGGEETGEEGGPQLNPDETHDEVRLGSHLILSFDAAGNRFVGTVENVSAAVLDQVRIEVHLSNGTELGPTPDASLDPGEMMDVELASTVEPFDTWSAHAEVGPDEHGCSDAG